MNDRSDAQPRPIGGEMLTWREADHGRPPVLGLVLQHLVTATCRPGARILFAGPHHEHLVKAAVATGAQVTCLLRGHADAEDLLRSVEHPAIEVFSGSLANFAPTDAFDLVVALDGLGRLASTETEEYRWGRTLDLLLRMRAPEGKVLLLTENYLGVHSLIRLVPATADPGDDAWRPVAEFDSSTPLSHEQLVEQLEDRGLHVGLSYGVYPEPFAPTVLASPSVLRSRGLSDAIDNLVAAAFGRAFAGRTVLTDPRRLSRLAIQAGAGLSLAAGWVVLAGGDSVVDQRPSLPDVVAADGSAGPDRDFLYGISRDGDDWRCALISGALVKYEMPGTHRVVLARDPARVPTTIARGQLLETVLLSACLSRDLPALRGILGRYAKWLIDQCDDRRSLAGSWGCATPRSVTVDEERFHLVDPSWVLTHPVPIELVMARGLWQFSADLVGGGYSHPWAADADPVRLTVILSSMAGMRVSEAVVREAISFQADIAAAIAHLDPTGRDTLAERLASLGPASPQVDLDGHRELRLALDRQDRQLGVLTARLQQLENALAMQTARRARAERSLRRIQRSASFRVGRALLSPARATKRLLAATTTRLARVRTPPGIDSEKR